MPLIDNSMLEVHDRRFQLAARFIVYAHLAGPRRSVYHALCDSVALQAGGPVAGTWYSEFSRRCANLNVDSTPRRGLAQAVLLGIRKKMNDSWVILISGSRMGVHNHTTPVFQFPAKKLSYTRILSLAGCRAVARLRSSSHMLNIECLRHTRGERIPREDRRCACCPSFVESEFHALFQCPDHAEAGEAFFKELFDIKPSLARLDQKALLGRLLNPERAYAAVTGAFLKAVFCKVDERYLVQE